MKTLLKREETYRVETETGVEQLIEEMKSGQGFELISYTSTYKEKKPTKAQLENIELAQQLKELLTTDFQAQKDLQAQLGIETSQKMTAIVKVLVNEGVAVKETVKRVSMVKLAD